MYALVDPLFNTLEIDNIKKHISISKQLSFYFKNKKNFQFVLILLNKEYREKRLNVFKYNKELYQKYINRYSIIDRINIKKIYLPNITKGN